jgi:succinate dehydrogenase flavin-adding protein (antitoxin of CptAB toxin-antitoxin module)
VARLQDLLDERDRLRDLEGWQVRASLLALKRSLKVFEGNTRELQQFLGEYDRAKGTLESFDVTDQDSFERFLDETDRLLHNFVAAAESLKDHAEKIKGRHLPDQADDVHTAEYRDRARAVFGSPVGSFVSLLRNHVLHERIPTTNGYLVWSRDRGTLKSGIALDRSELLAARDWSKKARNYMENAGSSILVHEVVAEYHDLVVAFYDWFDGAIRGRNQPALEELDARAGEVQEAWTAAWGPIVESPHPDVPGLPIK